VAAGAEYLVKTVVEEILGGRPVILPTDTVYGLCTTPYREEPVQRLYQLKGRDAAQPTAYVAADVDVLLESIPELRGRVGTILRALLPGPFTVVAPNPARRFPWLTGNSPETIGVRVPGGDGAFASVLERVSAVAATSANRPGEPDPKRLEEIPAEIRGACVLLDGGELPGVPSTVVDVTGPEPRILREGAVPSAETLERVRSAAA
jgi:tRNA threonylcarbamoyl adenosine modification protein (Sua5/YciO/YrdC/YwlC family)